MVMTRRARAVAEDVLLAPHWRDDRMRASWHFRLLLSNPDSVVGDVLALLSLATLGYAIDLLVLGSAWLSLLAMLPLACGLGLLALYAAARVRWRRMSFAQRLAYLEREDQWDRLLSVTGGVEDRPTAAALSEAVRALGTLRETVASVPEGTLAAAILSRAREATDTVSAGLWPQVALLASVRPVGPAGERALEARVVRLGRLAHATMDAAGALSALALTHGVGVSQDADADEALRRLRETAEALAAPL
jgi:hypothetical protein